MLFRSYRTGNGGGEAATGFTLYTETVVRALPAQPVMPRLYLPCGSDRAAAERYRREGWATVAGLATVDDAAAEAKRLRCSHRLDGEKLVALG